MARDIIQELPELVSKGVVPAEVAESIKQHYASQPDKSQSRMLMVFGVLGALLVSMGVILILAHNWDDLARSVKTIIAFIPLLAGQLLCTYTLIKKPESKVWREASTTILFFAVGTSISLVSQIYNIPGNIDSFLLTWIWLTAPLIYIMRSSMGSLLVLGALTSYGLSVGWSYRGSLPIYYWVMLPLIIPHYIHLYRTRRTSNFLSFHHWLIPISVLWVLGSLINYGREELLLPVYVSAMGLLYLVGNSSMFTDAKLRTNGYKIISSLGTLGILIASTYEFVWEELTEKIHEPSILLYIVIGITIASTILLIYQHRKGWGTLAAMEITFLIYTLIFFLGLDHHIIAIVIVNILVLTIGVTTVRIGAQKDNLGIINYGLLIITALIFARFVDPEMSFVLRGLLFIGAGVMFFLVNHRIITKRKEKEVSK